MPEKLKVGKTIIHDNFASASHIVFLGIFNADPFRKQIESWLTKLDLTDAHLFIADNCSTDNSLDWITELTLSLTTPYTVTSNKKNFGGYGNLATNLHKFRSANWITTLHQDDVYKPNHIRNHKMVINSKIPNLGIVCSEAISRLPNGKALANPRANWILHDDSDPVTIFLANLKNHTFPFSGATFAKQLLERFPIPWHSTSFPDTEIVLKMCAEYVVRFAAGTTVDYFENPNSESHYLSPQQRDFGVFQALTRVFAHPNYKLICELVPVSKRYMFIRSLVESIDERIEDEYLGLLMRQMALELTASYFGTFPELASELIKGYAFVGDHRAVELLQILGATSSGAPPGRKQSSKLSTQRAVNKFSRSVGLSILKIFPVAIRRYIFRAFMRSKFGKKFLRAWDFEWKKN